jgi:serine/threonine protein kinase
VIGETLGHYRITALLGEGGFGKVYRARDLSLERDVALKVLPEGALASSAERKRFRKEALALSRLNHPHVATIHAFETQGGVDFLVMEYLPGSTLGARLEGQPHDEQEAIALGIQIASGLEAAHAAGVIHRDLKPDNIAIGPQGQLKVVDFGLAKLPAPALDSSSTLSMSGAEGLTGTIPYMAPEQLLGRPAGEGSDLYALGVVLYELATGRHPFAGETLASMIDGVLHAPPPPPSRANAQLSSGIETVILKLLEKDPELRYRKARDLLDDLRELERAHASGEALPSPPRTRVHRRRRRRSALVATAATALGLAGLLAASRARRGPIDSLAVLPLVDVAADPESEYLCDGITEGIITSISSRSGLKVIARTSVFQYKGRTSDPRSVARATW